MKTTEELMDEHKKLNPGYTGSAVAPLPEDPERTFVPFERWADQQREALAWFTEDDE